jgi:general secretion pathway protein I
MRRSDGFTLIEVLVALAVLAIALAAVIDKTIESGANIGYLRDRTFAHWVAENKLTEMQAMDEWREGRQSGKSELASRTWYWQVESLPTPTLNLRRVVVRVSDRENAEDALAVLNGFLLKPEVRQGQGTSVGPGGQGPGGAGPRAQQNGSNLGPGADSVGTIPIGFGAPR